ncbi:hypothetical protein N7499_012287 [Penicillium canescens]|uniref:Uncharacterized protein n=1 Tax=Penicillium canescens TaxID=5083 RepID=A0AAD6I3Z8_PENCN|nr:uncharacterized protein N7446_001066 [Penicillium canescens]KAJ6029871.1 hypothetical protein N7460_010137 [Penicillium canescens]KAJ6060253.1 hypothetical protein N7444_002107 [Penicillium canescens]KAJ6063607.1 hypothetical protein N7499_012287 [Penicillium canescens]KAJ6078130.1 hypothetical protein N7446_001066 [Penicillium canescens]KAJ6154896.1 hypothetical protein N7485_013265 [Penicillium canescens]
MAQLFVDLPTPNNQTYRQPTGLFINNDFAAASSGQTITSIDPATDKPLATVPAASAEDEGRAVKAVPGPRWYIPPGNSFPLPSTVELKFSLN